MLIAATDLPLLPPSASSFATDWEQIFWYVNVVTVVAGLLVYCGIVLFGVSSGLIEPALRGMISQAAGPRDQGVVQGSGQSIQSLAMIIGPIRPLFTSRISFVCE